jgi:hypothetical protein
MKTYSYSSPKIVILIIVCLFFVGYVASEAMVSEAKRIYVAASGPGFQRTNGGGRLIVWRIANLGKVVGVNLWLDDAPIGIIVYGQTYDGFLPRGRHILSVTVSPRPTWPGWRMEIPLNVRDGQTYYFTAMGDHSGHLILKPKF